MYMYMCMYIHVHNMQPVFHMNYTCIYMYIHVHVHEGTICTIAQCSQGLQCIIIHNKPSSARERLCCTLLIGQKPKTAVQGLHLLSFGIP